jgi:hypothetical protein
VTIQTALEKYLRQHKRPADNYLDDLRAMLTDWPWTLGLLSRRDAEALGAWFDSDKNYGLLLDPLAGQKAAMTMTDDQFEAWQERVAIMVQEGGVPEKVAEYLAARGVIDGPLLTESELAAIIKA